MSESKLVPKLRFSFPINEEQEKIANFLSEVDNKIELIQRSNKPNRTIQKRITTTILHIKNKTGLYNLFNFLRHLFQV